MKQLTYPNGAVIKNKKNGVNVNLTLTNNGVYYSILFITGLSKLFMLYASSTLCCFSVLLFLCDSAEC